MSPGCHIRVKVKCDACGKEYLKEYREYLKGCKFDDGFGDWCYKCASKRRTNQTIKKYGGMGLQSPILKEKIVATNQEKYGCNYPMQNSDVYEKVRQTQEEKYGGIGMASKVTRNKIEATNMEIRGVRNPSQSEDIKRKKEETTLKHYGVPYIFQDPERMKDIIEKSRKTMWENKSIPTSKPEKTIVAMLEKIYGKENCTPGYLLTPLSFDCLLTINNVKIDVEYDGWYWHKDREEQDKRRNYKLLSLGYKILRIKSKNILPTEKQIVDAVNQLLNGKNLIEIKLDI